MTRQEFEQRYTNGNAETLAALRQHGRYAIPCTCGEPDCKGWTMASLLYGEPEEIAQIVSDYPEVAEKLDPAAVDMYKMSAQLYKIAAELNEKYA